MKIDELRALIKKHPRNELEFIIVNLYKCLTKAQKEGSEIDELISNPNVEVKQAIKKSGENAIRPFNEIEAQTINFIENATDGYYLSPNRIVPKNERPKWRFTVKNLFKEITALAKNMENPTPAANLLSSLYELLCYSCGFTTFTAYDTFESVGIDQDDFYEQVLKLYDVSLDKPLFIDKGISLIINNYVNRYTLYETLISVFVRFLATSDLKYMTIERTQILWDQINKETMTVRNNNSAYYKMEKLNHITLIAFFCYSNLYEFKNAIDIFEKLHIEKSPEVKLYVLIKLLFNFKEKEHIVAQLEKAIKDGIEPRKSLMDLKTYIISNNQLPDYF